MLSPQTLLQLELQEQAATTQRLKADFIKDLENFDFGEPPYSLIFPGELHFMEVDSLIAFAGAPAEFRRLTK